MVVAGWARGRAELLSLQVAGRRTNGESWRVEQLGVFIDRTAGRVLLKPDWLLDGVCRREGDRRIITGL